GFSSTGSGERDPGRHTGRAHDTGTVLATLVDVQPENQGGIGAENGLDAIQGKHRVRGNLRGEHSDLCSQRPAFLGELLAQGALRPGWGWEGNEGEKLVVQRGQSGGELLQALASSAARCQVVEQSAAEESLGMAEGVAWLPQTGQADREYVLGMGRNPC